MPVGFGTERLAERFEELFPKVAFAVLDRDAAARRGLRLDWRVHARTGVPVTLVTLAICAGYGGWRLSGG